MKRVKLSRSSQSENLSIKVILDENFSVLKLKFI